MAGGLVKYRHLSRSSPHRQALLRNLVTSLLKHESISTTWHKAKEAQPLAEKVITLAKKNTPASRSAAGKYIFVCLLCVMRQKAKVLTCRQEYPETIQKLFTTLRKRYENRPGGYTRVLRVEPLKEDQAESAILELVDGDRDMRFAMTARTIAKIRSKGQDINDMTAANIQKVTRYRPDGEKELEKMVKKFDKLQHEEEEEGAEDVKKRRVYPRNQVSR